MMLSDCFSPHTHDVDVCVFLCLKIRPETVYKRWTWPLWCHSLVGEVLLWSIEVTVLTIASWSQTWRERGGSDYDRRWLNTLWLLMFFFWGGGFPRQFKSTFHIIFINHTSRILSFFIGLQNTLISNQNNVNNTWINQNHSQTCPKVVVVFTLGEQIWLERVL